MLGQSGRIELRGIVIVFDRPHRRHLPNLLERRLEYARCTRLRFFIEQRRRRICRWCLNAAAPRIAQQVIE
jgi:hypothetical protein